MARSLSQTLIRTSHPAFFASTNGSPPQTLRHASRFLSLRNQSSQSDNARLVDPSDSDQREALVVQKIEDVIHRIIVRKSAPDWLPFRPGSSYWVPPRRKSYGIAELVKKMANTLTEEEAMSLTSGRGWPASAFFLDGTLPLEGVEATSGKDIGL